MTTPGRPEPAGGTAATPTVPEHGEPVMSFDDAAEIASFRAYLAAKAACERYEQGEGRFALVPPSPASEERGAAAVRAIHTLSIVADEAGRAWDREEDLLVGKLLRSLAGHLPGYRRDVDEALALAGIGLATTPPASAPEERGAAMARPAMRDDDAAFLRSEIAFRIRTLDAEGEHTRATRLDALTDSLAAVIADANAHRAEAMQRVLTSPASSPSGEPVSELARLRGIIERERSAANIWIERTRAEIGRRRGMATSRGSYEWDDDEYRQEFGAALDAIDKALQRAERETGARDLTDCPTSWADVSAARAAHVPHVTEGSD